jgi:hypothetical protein
MTRFANCRSARIGASEETGAPKFCRNVFHIFLRANVEIAGQLLESAAAQWPTVKNASLLSGSGSLLKEEADYGSAEGFNGQGTRQEVNEDDG